MVLNQALIAMVNQKRGVDRERDREAVTRISR